MPTDRWHRLEQLFTEAVALPAAERTAFIARACGPDDGIRDELTSLLTAADDSADFLASSALDAFARQISREGWSVRAGDQLGAYTIERRLGAGGMGEVWRARDARLGRDVAIKLLLPHPSNAADRILAFQREARAVGTLNHPNVVTVYDIGEHDGAPYLVTECLGGEPLRARLAGGALAIDAALDIALQVARGLDAAHTHGIAHRDLKPENIFLSGDGRVKVLDFGLATLLDPVPRPSPLPADDTPRTSVAGTASYMAPEQVRGELADHRADIFALGAVLFEMIAGRRAFKGDSTLATLDLVLTFDPGDLSDVRPRIPPAVARIVRRCLAKAADDRFSSIGEVASALESIVRARTRAAASPLALLRRPAGVATALVLLVLVAAGVWRWRAIADRRNWARTVAALQVQVLSGRGDAAEAFFLARQTVEILPEDPLIRQLWLDVSMTARVTTDPPGADASIAPYRSAATWVPLGRTPLIGVRIPRGVVRLQLSKSGFQTIEGSMSPPGQRYHLDPVSAVPAGMVRVNGGRDATRFGGVGDVDDFWIDRFEVTNRQFKEFVDRGGYRRRAYWRELLIDHGRSLTWEDALARFRDGTGQPGPATWRSGTYPDGQADFPVGGVSWYEAQAYVAFAGKSLPTMYHWYRAAAFGRFADILAVSNFNEQGPAPVGSYRGLGTFGTYDMAGNVKEWCVNETGGRRFLLGGAWDEPRTMFGDFDAREPFERAAEYGFRGATYLRPLSAAVLAPVPAAGEPKPFHPPVGDDIFAIYRRQYAADHPPLNAQVEATETTEAWVKQTIAFDAAYNGERMHAFLLVPRIAPPPYQTVVFFPAGDAFNLRSSAEMSLAPAKAIVQSGRAFLYPVYKGTYERTSREDTGPNTDRELRIAWSRDLGRAIDYLETRADIDRDRLAFYGISEGADAGVLLTALEPRLKASVLQGTDIWSVAAPEIDPINFAPRVRLPTLLLNGRYDFATPVETAQRPLFALLGTPAEHKRLRLFETGHAQPAEDVAREILPWLDRYLGPIVAAPAHARR
ncbi:MAG TPA: protein kinase [Vicinamibacterales bacterium]|nr:protein kinase [Vicinamibacterales bacterium]